MALFIVKHFIADFVLQPGWMAHGKNQLQGWLLPSAAHALVHAGATAAIFGFFAPRFIWLAVLDFALHFGIDRAKVLVNRAYVVNPLRQAFWVLFGIDQTMHELTNIAFALVLATTRTSI